MAAQKTYTTQEIYEILANALILLQDKTLTVSESERYNEKAEEVEKRVSLVDYIVRAVGDELIEHYGETETSVKEAIRATKIDFDEFVFPNEEKCVGIYNDIR